MAKGEAQAQLKVGVDTEGAVQNVDVLVKKVKELGPAAAKSGEEAAKGFNKTGDEAEKAAAKLQKAQDRIKASIERQYIALTQGPVGVAEARLRAAGVDEQTISRQTAKLRQAVEANRQFGQSVRATGYALSLVPAQITDIATQLAGGQSPFLVLVQQGGQLKDMFGGIGPAVQAVGGYLLKLVTPLNVAIAAFAALGFAYVKGEQEAVKFNKALILTGNSVGLTASQLAQSAENIGNITGNTAKAANALTALVNAGRFSGEQLEKLGKSVIEFSEATGQSVEEVSKEFATLTDDPVKGIEKLNDKYNFLTNATYQQIKALQEQGRVQEAATLAIETFRTETDRMSIEVQSNLGLIERGWNAITGAVGKATSAILNIGRATSTAELESRLKTINASLETYNKLSGIAADSLFVRWDKNQLLAERDQIIADLTLRRQNEFDAANNAAEQAFEREKIIANNSIDALIKSGRKKEEIRAAEIAKLDKQLKEQLITEERYLQGVAAINERYKDPQGRAVTDDAATRMLQNLREQEAATLAQIGNAEKLTSAEREYAKFTQLIADLKTKDILTADQQSLLLMQDQIKAQLNRNIAAENGLRIDKERNDVIERGKQIAEAIAQSEQTRARQYENQLNALGMGREAFNRVREEADIRREFQKYQFDLAKKLSEGSINTPEFKAQQDAINNSLQQSLQNFRDYYSQLDTLQSDWALGFKAGFSDYAASAANALEFTSNSITNSFKGMEDALVGFVRTGKADFSSLVDSMINDLVRLSLRQAVLGPIAKLLTSFIGSGLSSVANTQSTYSLPVDLGSTSMSSLATGGYTGDGGKYQPAGIVHKGEYVLNQEATQRLGVGLLDRLNRGYVNGGLVGGAATSGMSGGNININIKNEAGGDGYQATARATQNEGGIDVEVLVRKAIASDLRNNGALSQQFSSTFGLRRSM